MTSQSIEPTGNSSPPLPSLGPPAQAWTLDGYPIVDGKYHDLVTNQIKVHSGLLKGGPPSVSVYWHNRGGSDRHDQFYAVGCLSTCKVTDYIIRVGEMLKKEKCVVSSLNATEYAINVVVVTALSTKEFMTLLRDHGLLAS